MCTLYGHKVSRAEVAAWFQAHDDWRRDMEKDYVSPGREGYVIVRQNGERVLTAMNWGFPPPQGVARPVVNVRNYSSPYWMRTIADTGQRCIVPATRFQEWSTARDPATGKKHAEWFHLPSQEMFGFAGIWRKAAEGNIFAFLTCDPNPVVGAVNAKSMPVILHPEDYDRWLTADYEEAVAMAVPFPSQLMTVEGDEAWRRHKVHGLKRPRFDCLQR